MDAADDPPFVAALVRAHRRRSDLPCLVVHDDDEMWGWSQAGSASSNIGLFAYFRAGLAISDTLRAIAEAHLAPGEGRILDFACGYGRSLRFTAQDFGPERVWGCEILPGAVQFVGDALGVHALQSSTSPDDLAIDERFDLIFLSSLFSHLPERTFVPWLRKLHSLLTPTGLLVISVHDEILLPPGAELDGNGFYFQPTTEVEELDTADYGATVVNERFVAAAIEDATGSRRYRRLPTALCFEQDLYLVPAAGLETIPDDRISHGNQGAVDSCGVTADAVLSAEGWAATQDLDDEVVHVELQLDGVVLGTATPGLPRPDVAAALHQPDCLNSGWRFSTQLTSVPAPGAVLLATAVSRLGRRDVVWATSVGDLQPGLPVPVPVRPGRARRLLRRGR